jgi:hypothetical protein
MNWENTKQIVPEIGKIVLVEYYSGDIERKEYRGPRDWWERNIKTWLNEELSTDPVFTLSDLDKVWDKTKQVMCDYFGESEFLESEYVDERKKIFFKEQFKIELP